MTKTLRICPQPQDVPVQGTPPKTKAGPKAKKISKPRVVTGSAAQKALGDLIKGRAALTKEVAQHRLMLKLFSAYVPNVIGHSLPYQGCQRFVKPSICAKLDKAKTVPQGSRYTRRA